MLEGGKSSYSREVGSVCCKAVLVIVYSLLKVWFTNPLAAGSDFFQVRWGPCLSHDNTKVEGTGRMAFFMWFGGQQGP